MITKAVQVFPSKPETTFDQWSMSTNPRPHLAPVSPPLLPQGLLLTAEHRLLNGRCDRTHHKMGFKGGGVRHGAFGLPQSRVSVQDHPNLTTE